MILQKFGVQMFYPYVLMRIKDVNQNDNDRALLDDFKVLESFIMRRKISPRGTHDYTSKCYMIIKDGINKLIETELGSGEGGISDVDVKQYLASTKDDAAKMILFWIELYRRRSPSFDINALEYKYTLEHIMPKKWEANWSGVPIIDNGTTLDSSTEEGKAFRNGCIQSIGNKTLLTSSLNSTVRNAKYIQKIDGISPGKPGYRSHTSLLLTKELVDRAGTDPVWDEEHIAMRAGEIYRDFIEIWPSFKDRVPAPETEERDHEEDVSQFTAEQLADPLKLLEAMDKREAADETGGMMSVDEFVRMVNVQSETIERYIRAGTVIPDSIVTLSEHRNMKLFKEETVKRYAEQFGWTIISDENRKDIFLNMVERMNMSYSYKPVLIKALFDCVDDDGKCGMPELITRFMDFYQKRIADGAVPEKVDSALSKPDCTYDEAEYVVLKYPLRRFSDIGALHYDKENNEVSFDAAVWAKLSASEKQSVVQKCAEKIAEYFDRL